MKFTSALIAIFAFFTITSATAKESYKNNFEWQDLPAFPAQGGDVVASLAGTSGEIIAVGGADGIAYILKRGGTTWDRTSTQLRGKFASFEGGALLVDDYSVKLIQSDNSGIKVQDLPNFPQAIAQFSAVIQNKVIYIATTEIWSLNLANSKSDWHKVNTPLGVIEDPVLVSQNGAESTNIYIFGSDNYGLVYNPTKGEWRKTSTHNLNLKGSNATPIAGSHILYAGVEGGAMMYNTLTDTWSEPDGIPVIADNSNALATKDGFIVVGSHMYRGKVVNKPAFGVVNWLVLGLYMLTMLYMGYYFMRKNNNSTDDFFKGGGRVPWWASGISLFATMLSAITFMAIPAKAFATDWRYFPMAITILIMAFPVIKYYLPFFKRLNITTAYEYLEARFNYVVRFLSSSLFIIFMVARMALTLFLPSLALTTVTGIDIYLCIILMGVITLIYSTMGGAEAVIWSDVVQGFILLGGAVFVVVFLLSEIPGGVPKVIEVIVAEDKMRMFDFSFIFSSATFWVIILGGLANNLISYSSDQTAIQRYITTKSEKGVKKSIMLNGILSVVVSVIFYFIGTALYVFYKTAPEKVNYMMQNTDAIFPHYIMAEIPIGFAGLIIAAIFAATMSTVSSNINSLSTAYTVDIFRHFSKNESDQKELSVARWSGVVLGSVGIGVAILMASMNILSLLDFFNYLLGLLSSGIAGLFVVGIFLPRVGAKSALLGFVFGNATLFAISLYTNISFLLYGFIGIVLTVLFSLLFSLFIKNNKNINGYTWKTISQEEVE